MLRGSGIIFQKQDFAMVFPRMVPHRHVSNILTTEEFIFYLVHFILQASFASGLIQLLIVLSVPGQSYN